LIGSLHRHLHLHLYLYLHLHLHLHIHIHIHIHLHPERERVMGVEDEIRAVVAELGSVTDIPGGPYVNMWSGLGTVLENNQAGANLVGRIAQQVKATDGSSKEVSQNANQASAAVDGARVQLVVVLKDQWDEEFKVSQIGGDLLQLTQLLDHVQQEMPHWEEVV
jgi:hypothetical protein